MTKLHSSQSEQSLDYRTLVWFFLPLGFSASLVTVSHVIINSTLARAVNPALAIASYSIAMSLFTIFEKSAFILRPTSARLIRDKVSFKAVSKVTIYVLLTVLGLSLLVAYSFVGKWVFTFIFGVKDELLQPTLDAYRILLFVTIFSGIRCLFQGIIISNFRTKWMTISMVVRLLIMAGLAWCLVKQGWVTHSYIGAIIFLTGMFIEALVSTIEGIHLIKQLPERKSGHDIENGSQVLSFYRPLLLASLIAVLVQPATNATLGWSEKGEIAVASYAVAWSMVQLLVSFTSYMHQIVINFICRDAQRVIRFSLMVSHIPLMMFLILAYTPLGIAMLQHVMGLTDDLLQESLMALKLFIVYVIVFPWVDFLHGMAMHRGNTKMIAFSQTGNVIVTGLILFILVQMFASLGGAIGTFSIGTGFLAELLLLICLLRRKMYMKRGSSQKKASGEAKKGVL
ncbi:multi antimicrobial extrusion protein MatE [Caldalkalibacillus thermarum TA2.A1]|uniref:Multi antimicrobial extrusion protein MatE n=1 Tax=Caldalkalibacillus thermarum (strain TA2.A1) TaxID=986075 RepID=F5LAU2_CALTT|nr:hypothetical protein [Caldalkalibacillus thermarum]EGL81481.1 multi antimicrobial extrusion protein MatE [Caldalkalibacillus thermarum TA2.A1]QZT33787.1 multi antimicrobial extrusion protein MatE [Caldalkalibacillus thermarum TA2.A1]